MPWGEFPVLCCSAHAALYLLLTAPLFTCVHVCMQAGGAAGTAVDMSLFPLDTIKTRCVVCCAHLGCLDRYPPPPAIPSSSPPMPSIHHPQNRLQSSEGFWKAGGFRGIYKGLGAAAAGSAPGGACVCSHVHVCISSVVGPHQAI